MKTRICALAVTAALAAAAFGSCGKGGSSSSEPESTGTSGKVLVDEIDDDVNVSAGDMPYGANLLTLAMSDGYNLTIEGDSRYYTKEELELLGDYFWSICSKDGALYDKTVCEPVNKALLEESGYADSQEFVNDYYEKFKEVVGVDFKFDYFYAADFKDESSQFNFAYYDGIIAKAVPDGKVTKKVAVPAYLTYTGDDGTGGEVIQRDTFEFPMGVDLDEPGFIWICLYEIDGKSYVVA